MDVNDREVRRLAGLVKIDLDAADVAQLENELSLILGYVDVLNRLDTKGAEPMVSGSPGDMTLRDDAPAPSLSPADIAYCAQGAFDPARSLFAIQPVFAGKGQP